MDYRMIARSVFPDYHGRKIRLKEVSQVTFYDTNWSGGTRNKYIAVRLEDLKKSVFNAPAPWVNPVEGKTIPLPVGFLILEHSFFCGRDSGITIYHNPANQLKVKEA